MQLSGGFATQILDKHAILIHMIIRVFLFKISMAREPNAWNYKKSGILPRA